MSQGARCGIVVQSRAISSRLPGKAHLDLAGATITHHVLRALREIPADEYIVATDEKSVRALKLIVEDEGWSLFVGSPETAEDVLLRFLEAGQQFGLADVIRATGDNPLVSPRLAREILNIHRDRDADLSHYRDCPWGSGVEVVSLGALLETHSRADYYEREHMTTYIYRHQDEYRVVEEASPADCGLTDPKDLVVSVDTADDYEFVRRIFDDLYEGHPIEIDKVIRWWKEGHR